MKKLLLALALVLSVGLSVFAFFPAATVKQASAEETTETAQTFEVEFVYYSNSSIPIGIYALHTWKRRFTVGVSEEYKGVPDDFQQDDLYYTFKGWRTPDGAIMSAPLTIFYTELPSTTPKFTAVYDITDTFYHTVTFVTLKGFEKRQVLHGEHIPKIEALPPAGYRFGGWSTEREYSSGESLYNAEKEVVTTDLVLYPVFFPDGSDLDEDSATDSSKTEIEETIDKGFSAIGITGLTFTAQIAIIVAGVLILIQIFK